MTPLLDIQDLEIHQNKRVLVKQVSFQIEQGQAVGLVGASGSGKTLVALSLLRLLPSGISIHPNSQILWRGKNLVTQSEIRMRALRAQKMGLVFQDAMSAFNPVLPIGRQIRERCHGHRQPLSQQQLYALLDQVGIVDPVRAAQSYPHELSGGMRQRAMIALALASDPELLIADEPTTALDVSIQTQVLDTLKTLQKQRNMAMLFISHDLGVVSHVADEIMVMRQGALIEKNAVQALFTAPQHEGTRQLLSTIPDLTVRATEKPNIPLLQVSGVSVHVPIKSRFFKRTIGHIKVVDRVRLMVHAGKTLALIGASGSGKTTLANSLLGLIPKTEGTLDWQQEAPRPIQVVFQDPYAAMNPRMTIGDILEEGMRAHDLKNRAKRIEYWLNEVQLPLDFKYRYPHECSGGQRQRICIARALCLSPQFIICDEPTSALDVCVQQQIINLLQHHQAVHHMAYLLITHDLGVVAHMAHEVAVLSQGRVVEQGSTQQVFMNPQHACTQSLIAHYQKRMPRVF